jgi:hypothetical protein
MATSQLNWRKETPIRFIGYPYHFDWEALLPTAVLVRKVRDDLHHCSLTGRFSDD